MAKGTGAAADASLMMLPPHRVNTPLPAIAEVEKTRDESDSDETR